MNDFFTRQLRSLVGTVLDPIESAGTRLLGIVAIGGVAVACLIAAIAFISIALDQWLAQLTGPVIAALCTAGFYLVIGVICLLVLRARNGTKPQIPPASVPPAEKSDVSASIEDTVAPFVAILYDTGLIREEVAVRLGTEMAKQLGPVGLVATALVAGFILQRSLIDSNKPPR